MPKISVVMPVYNGELYLREAIDSILGQTYTDFEFIIINDGSTDNTEEIINSYADSRIVYLKNEINSGIVYTLNRGLESAKGEYIARMDADDISLPSRFEKQIKFLDKNTHIAVCGTSFLIFGSQIKEYTFIHSNNPEMAKAELFFSSSLGHPSVMIRKAIIDKYSLKYEKDYQGLEDYVLWWRIAKFGDIVSLKEPLLKYRQHSAQITATRKPEIEEKHNNFLKERLNDFSINYSKKEFEVLSKYCNGYRNVLTIDDLETLTSVFTKLLRANRKTKLFKQYYFKKNISFALFNAVNVLVPTKKQKIKHILSAFKNNVISFQILIKFLLHISVKNRGFRGILLMPFVKIKNIITKLKLKHETKVRRKKLKNTDFSIISNNCWSSFIYQKYGLKYMSPTAGLYILGDDFVKFCSRLDWYLEQKLIFIKWEDATYYNSIKNETPYPVAQLGDIEIYFMHYATEEEAENKWYRRAKRINKDKLIFKLSQREKCAKEDIIKFINLPLKNKVCFAYDDVPGVVLIPELKGWVGDEQPIVEKYYDEVELINSL